MRTKSILGALLMFLLTIGFTSCSDDNKLENRLKLSENSCEVMQGGRITVELTTHENTTLDIKDSELIDAVYTWRLDGNKAEIEIIGKQKGETDIVVTNHVTGEFATINVIVMEYPMPCLGVRQSKGNIFDMMDFYLYNEDSRPINFGNLDAICDSIVWTVDGTDGSKRVFEHEEGDDWTSSQLSFKWGHCFLFPGAYTTNLTVWKDNKVINSQQLDITITDRKDFLLFNWSDITKNSHAWIGYADVLKSSPDLITSYGLNNNVPYGEVRIFSEDVALKYHLLYDYFRKLYSAPTYEDTTEKHKMWQRYDELFFEQKKYPNAYPVAIWVTERTNIVLLLIDESAKSSDYVIYAEPNRQ